MLPNKEYKDSRSFIIVVDYNGIIKNFTPQYSLFNLKLNDSINNYILNEDKPFTELIKEVIKNDKACQLIVKFNNTNANCKLIPVNSENLVVIVEQIIDTASENDDNNKNTIELIGKLFLEFSTLDDNVNPYVFIGEKLKLLFPNCTIIVNKYEPHNDLFVSEYIYSYIDQVSNYITSLKKSISKISFSLPPEQRVYTTYGRLVELKKEDFFSALYYFNKELLDNLLSNVPLYNIYIIGLISNSYLFGNITILAHEPNLKLEILEPIVNHTSLLIQKRIVQEKLNENHKFYQSLLNTTQEIIIVVDDNNKIIYSNKVCQDFFIKNNLSSNILNENITDVLYILNHKFFDKFKQAQQQQQPITFDISTSLNNKIYFFKIQINPIVNINKLNYIINIKDISETILSKREINHLSEVNKIIIENLNEGVILINENFQIIQCNSKFLDLFSFKKEEVFSKSIFDLMPNNLKEKATKVLKSLFEERSTFTQEFTITKEGKNYYLKEEIFPIIENNTVKYLISIIRDCTQEKQKEEELLESKLQAEKKERIKSTLIATISHEIRTPLNTINGFANLLLKQDLSESKKLNYISHINQSSYFLTRLIDDLIDISNIETGRISIKKNTIFIYPIFEQLYEQFLQELIVRQKNNVKLILTNTPEDNIPFHTDELRVRQIISNLLSNSIKYTLSGEIKFGYSLMNNCLIFFVKDTGIGIKKDQIESIFEPFNKTKSNYYTDTDKSLGLGLYIVKSIIEQLNGTLHIESETNKGTTFSIRFPYSQIDQTTTSYHILQNEIKPFKIEKEVNILIAEDDDLNFMFLEEMLSQETIRIIRAKNGIEAVELFKKHHCNLHLVLMDIQMPIMDGFTATKLIKEINPLIPVIAQTAYAYATEKEESFNVGCCDYLVKPLNQNELLSKIAYYTNTNSL